MIKVLRCDMETHDFQRLSSLDQIADQLDENDPRYIFWLDIVEPNDWELGWVARKFGLHPLAIEDASSESQRPKIEEYSTFFFLVFFTLQQQRQAHVETRELDIFVGENFLITVHQEPLPELDEMERRYFRNLRRIDWGIGLLLYVLLDSIVDSYQPLIEQLTETAEDFEETIFVHRTQEQQTTMALLHIKRRATIIRRLLVNELDVLKTLIHRNIFFDRQVIVYFRDVSDHLERMTGTLDQIMEELRTALDANLAFASHQLNKIVRTLTVASIILMMNALIAGIYGMNFADIPELSWRYGYPWALGLMTVSSLLLIFFFKRLHWF